MTENKHSLCVVIPAFNEEQMIECSYQTIHSILSEQNIAHEFMYVDDGSSDGTWNKITQLAAASSIVHGISFSRNFGKESAIHAGLSGALDYDCCVVIDCDLQHPPEKIVEMYRLWQKGYEVVEGVKAKRSKEAAVNSLGARAFYKLMHIASGFDMESSSDFKLLDHKAVETITNMTEKGAFFRAQSFWIGYRTAQVDFEVRERTAGQSKWSVLALSKYAIRNLTSFTSAPLQYVTVLGIISILAAAVLGVIGIVRKLSGRVFDGFTAVIVLILLIGGIIMIGLGILGYYLAKVYDEVRQRPVYIIQERTENTYVEEAV